MKTMNYSFYSYSLFLHCDWSGVGAMGQYSQRYIVVTVELPFDLLRSAFFRVLFRRKTKDGFAPFSDRVAVCF